MFTDDGLESAVHREETEKMKEKARWSVQAAEERQKLRPPTAKSVKMQKPGPPKISKEKQKQLAEVQSKKEGDKAWIMCKKYKQAFPQELRDIKICGATASAAEKIECLEEIRIELNSKGAAQNVKDKYAHLLGAVQLGSELRPDLIPLKLSHPISLKAVAQSPNFQEAIDPEAKQLGIEYAWLFSQGPFARLLDKTVQAITQIHSENVKQLQNSDSVSDL